MPRKIDDSQGALTLFFDLRQGEPGDEQEVFLARKQEWSEGLDYWEELFSELFIPQEVYYKTEYTPETFPIANTISTDLKCALAEHRIKLPHDGRECLVFCYYMRLQDITLFFAEKLDEMIRSFANLFAVDDSMQHIHLLCVEYERSEMLPDLEQKVALLSMLASKEYFSAFSIMLLYSSQMRSTLGDQRKGLVNLLYLLSRNEEKYKLFLQSDRWKMKMLSYQDYYENQALDCRREIESINQWLKVEIDPEFSGLHSSLQQKISELSDRFLRALRSFQQRVGTRPVYPVRITQFEKVHLFQHEIRNIESIPIFQQIREIVVQEELDRQLDKFQPSELEEMNTVIGGYHYPDLVALHNMLRRKPEEKGSLEELLSDVMQDRKYQTELNRLRSGIGQKLRSFLLTLSLIAETDRIQREKISQKDKTEEQERKAGEYSSIEDCFDRIVDKTTFGLNTINRLLSTNTYVQINDQINSVWESRNYSIKGANEVCCCPEIEPYEVAVLKIGSSYDLRKREEVEALLKSMSG